MGILYPKAAFGVLNHRWGINGRNKMTIFAAVKFNIMKQQKTIVTILLNILFCAALLWFFSRNAILRPSLGSRAKEVFSGLLLLATLYANYYLFYPKLYRGHTSLYWSSVVIACLAAGGLELALGYTFISKCNVVLISEVGPFNYFATKLLFIVFRNLAFNLFAYVLRERKQLQQSLETESKVVYQFARMLDVCDDKNNCQHIPIDKFFYCKKNGNETEIHTIEGFPVFGSVGSWYNTSEKTVFSRTFGRTDFSGSYETVFR